MKDNIIEINSVKESKNPIIKVIDNKNFYDIYIFLQDLTKEEITIKHINNFLILNLSLKNKYNNLLSFKRMFSTSSPTYPASVSVVASAIANGTFKILANVLARSVFPQPVGPSNNILLF